MTKWTELGGVAKAFTAIGAAFVFIIGSTVGAIAFFQTSDDAEDQHKQIKQEFHQHEQQVIDSVARGRIDVYELRKDDYELILLDPDLPKEKREYYRSKQAEADNAIACIREHTC